MSGIGKHNVITYLEACGKYQKYENSCEIEELTQLMEGYAQLYHNNQKKANGATAGEKQCNLPVVSGSFLDNYHYHPENEGTAKTFRNIVTEKWYYESELCDVIGITNVDYLKANYR